MRTFAKRNWVLLTLLAAGLAVRIYAAWCFAYSLSPDHGIASLMAKHIAEGKEFPVFFYGQQYLGSLEPMVCAIFLKTMGVSGFAVNLGTALFGFLLLPLVYMWGRDVAGRTAGLVAVAFCIVGPVYYFQYQSWGNGGYAATMFLGTTVLWLGSRIAAREASGVNVGWASFLVLGLAGGLGWWTNQLVVASLGTAALLLLIGMPKKLFTWRAAVGAAGFALGSAPFWIWNACNEWATFVWMSKMAGGVTFREGVKQVVRRRLPSLLAPQTAHELVQKGMLFLYVAIIVYLLWVLIVHFKRHRLRGRTVAVLAPLLFVVVFCAFYSSSSQVTAKTPRYGLPLIPVFGVILGGAVVNMRRVSRLGLRWLPLLVLVTPHVWRLPEYSGWRAEHLEHNTRNLELIDYLAEQDIKSVYAPYGAHYINFMLGEKVCFADLFKERYVPYKVDLELADRLAVLDNHGWIRRFYRETGGSGKRVTVGGYSVCFNLAPPKVTAAPIDPSVFSGVVDNASNDVLSVVADGNAGTAWYSSPSQDNPAWLDIDLSQKTEIVGIRIVAANEHYPVDWQIFSDEGNGWQPYSGKMKMSHYYWSGPRPYWAYEFYRSTCRLAPRETRRIRVMFSSSRKGRGVEIAEIQLLRKFGHFAEMSQEHLDELYGLIEERALTSVYSDRWLANRIYQQFEGQVATCRREMLDGPTEPLTTDIYFDKDSALVVEAGEAAQCRTTLNNAGIQARETAVGERVVFDQPDTSAPVPALYWAGFSCFQNSPR